ncbi:hypothetical protein [Octadecabacter antarcticus]|uniref:hypothetical protein n=1 Tax=Octadecabacter antarcticus TaxID=1217908 RepID=UPI00018063C3|nr:hypothetical protein [Octadecabacter antarcticus]
MTVSHTTNPPSKSPLLAFMLLALVKTVLIFTIALIAVPLPHIGTEFGLNTSELILLQVSYGLPYTALVIALYAAFGQKVRKNG